jgi:hypothetical protein
MTVIQLIAELSCYSEHSQVLIACDPEGNKFSPTPTDEDEWLSTVNRVEEVSVILTDELYSIDSDSDDSELVVVLYPR